jgi:hypothetical protein
MLLLENLLPLDMPQSRFQTLSEAEEKDMFAKIKEYYETAEPQPTFSEDRMGLARTPFLGTF